MDIFARFVLNVEISWNDLTQFPSSCFCDRSAVLEDSHRFSSRTRESIDEIYSAFLSFSRILFASLNYGSMLVSLALQHGIPPEREQRSNGQRVKEEKVSLWSGCLSNMKQCLTLPAARALLAPAKRERKSSGSELVSCVSNIQNPSIS